MPAEEEVAVEDTFDMTPVASSQIAAVGYGAKSRELRVEFNNGALYAYSGVPENVYQNLAHAASPGSYFHSAVKNAGFPFVRIA